MLAFFGLDLSMVADGDVIDRTEDDPDSEETQCERRWC